MNAAALVTVTFRKGESGYMGADPARGEGVSKERYKMLEEAYDAGFAAGEDERVSSQVPDFNLFTSTTHRRTGRRPR